MDSFKTFKSFKLIPNSKNPACAWKNPEKQTLGLDVQNFKNGDKKINDYNVGVLTGKINNIVVVDIDMYKFKEGNQFLKDLGGLDFIKSLNTFTVKTPRGGYHVYFEYEEEIYTTANSEIQVDIRSDGGFIIKYGSLIDNKMYQVIINESIKKMPTNLKEWLIKHITPPKKNKIVKLDGEKITHKLEVINYSIDFINEIRDTLNKTKINLFIEPYSFLKFTNGMKLLGLSKEWDAYNKTQDNYNLANNIKYWNSCDTEHYNFVNWICDKLNITSYLLYKPILKNVIQPIKSFFKPKLDYDLYEQLDQEFEEYEEVIKNIKTKELTQIGDNFYPNYEEKKELVKKNKSYIMKSDTGTGKTTSFKKYVKNNNLKFISIVSRVSLGEDHYNNFSEESINCKFYVYDTDFNNSDSIIIQLDSIRKLHSINFSDYVIFLDEFNSIIEYLISSETLQNVRILIFQKLLYIMKNCKKIICVDADISDLCLYFINYANIDYVFLENTYKHNKDVKAEEVFDDETFFEDLKNEPKFLCCCDSKKEAEVLHQKLKDENIKALLITSDTEDQIPKLDSHDRIIYSPRIVYGVDSLMKRPVYAYYTSRTINPKSMVQQIARCRNISYLKFMFKKKKYVYNGETYEEHIKNLEETNIYSNNEFKNLTDEETYKQYFKLIVYYEYNQKSYNTNKFAHFLNLIDERGFIRDKTKKFITKSKGNREVKEAIYLDKLENFNLNDYSEINKILRLSEEQAEEHKDLFLDKYKLTKHFNLSNFINHTEEKIKASLLEKLDFNVVKIKSDKSKIVFLKKVKKLFKNEDIEIDSKGVSEQQSNKINEEYNHYFDKLTKKVNYTDKYECDKLQARIYKSLFTDGLVISEKDNKRGENRGKRNYEIDFDVIEEAKELYNIRNPSKNVDFID